MWTDERVELLRRYWSQGYTASVVARMLGGCSRNAVIGKVHRMGWRTRSIQSRPKAAPRPPVERRAKPIKRVRIVALIKPIPAPIRDPIQAGGVSLIDLEQHQCRFPVTPDSAASHRFCGCPTAPGLSYCEGHARLAYRAPDPTPKRSFIPRGAVGIKRDVTVIRNAAELLDA